jgi:transcriptional regulator with XRE-family HTH domain
VRGNHLVQEARKRAGLTQAELAERVGTTQSVISRLERGATAPSMETISELVRACGLELGVRLTPYDDHDWELAKQNLRLSPAQRIRKAAKAARLVRDLRRAPRAHAPRT